MFKATTKTTTRAFLISLCCLSSPSWASSPYTAARDGDLEALRQYRFEGIDLFVPDERGFTPYELVALHADPEKSDVLQRHVEVMLWLKEYQADKHRYGQATIGLIQAGLNALGYAAGIPDGVIGKQTVDAIRAYQKDNDLAETGRPGPQWLGMFYQDALKDAQFKLTKLGFNTQGTDGLMGQKTRRAMLAFRAENNLEQPNYPNVDAALLIALNKQFTGQEKRRKAVIAKKAREDTLKATRGAQASLKALGYRVGKVDGMAGSKTSNAIKAFQKKYQLPVTGELNPATKSKMHSVVLLDTQRKLNALGYAVGKADGKMGKRTQAALRKYRANRGLSAGATIDATLLSSLQGRYIAQENQRETTVADNKRGKATDRTRYAQAGLRTLGHRIGHIDGMMGSKTSNAIKAFQKRYKLSSNGQIDDKTFAKMRTIFLKETQRKLNALGYKVGKPDGQLGARTQRAIAKFLRTAKLSGNGVSADLIAAVDDRYDRRNSGAAKNAPKTTTKNKQRTVVKVKASTKSSASKDVVQPKTKTVVQTKTGGTTKASNRGGAAAKGRMSFKRKNSRVVGCSIAGRDIPIEWCEPFYPLPKKNHCVATFKPSGAVINLWCK